MIETNTNNESNGNGAGISLKVAVTDKDGNLTAERCKDGDIFLKNWGLLVAGVLKYMFCKSAGGQYIFQIVNGTTIISQNAEYPRYGGPCNLGRIALGGSKKAATVYDYCAGSEIIQVVPNVPAIANVGNVIKTIFTGTASFEGDVTLAEVSLYVNNPFGGGLIAITRDTFDPVTVTAGGTITVQFEIWWNGMPGGA